MNVALLVIAKAPLPGRAKTRLCPPCSYEQAAALAEAALLDTLEVVARTPAHRKVLVFDGDGERWRPPGFELIAAARRGPRRAARRGVRRRRGAGPAGRHGHPAADRRSCCSTGPRRCRRPGVDAVLGPALDGGYWSVGLKRPARQVFDGVPMSVEHTCAAQRARIQQLGLRLHEQAPLRDVDTIDDARAVAEQAPATRFAAAMAAI